MRLDPTNPKTVLVTGASTGIGLALARLLRGAEFRSVLTARAASLGRFKEAGIEESENILIRPMDVTRAEEREAVIGEIERRWGGVDLLVNNAGVCYRAVQEHVTERDELDQFEVNYFAAMRLIRRVLPHMRARRWGRVVNVSSVGGMMAMPTMSLYSASKFALEGASEGLWYELRPWNIAVSLVEPGFINSSGFERVRIPERGRGALQETGAAYHAHYAFMSEFISRCMRRAWATPESVARRILWTLRHRNPPLRVPGTIDARLFSLLRRLLPRGLYHRFLYRCLPRIGEWGEQPGEQAERMAGADLKPASEGEAGTGA